MRICLVCKEMIHSNFWSSVKATTCIICGVSVHKLCLLHNQTRASTKIQCKSITTNPTVFAEEHQLRAQCQSTDDECIVCHQATGSIHQYKTKKCLTCNKFVHEECQQSFESSCVPHRYSNLLLLPKELIVKPYTDPKPKPSFTERFKKTSQTEPKPMSEEDQALKDSQDSKQARFQNPNQIYTMVDKTKVHVDVKIDSKSSSKRRPTIFIINRLSGPQFGDTALEYLYLYFNPIQVIDLIDEGLGVLDLFLHVKNLQVVVGGGDGTIASIATHIISKKPKENDVRVVPMPFGTGNDLSCACGWGKEVSTQAH
jgi:hypothetical protein